MSDDKMREEFEAWAKVMGFDLSRIKLHGFDSNDYASSHTSVAEDGFEAGYAAGRKAEREATQLKNWDGIRLGAPGTQEGERWT